MLFENCIATILQQFLSNFFFLPKCPFQFSTLLYQAQCLPIDNKALYQAYFLSLILRLGMRIRFPLARFQNIASLLPVQSIEYGTETFWWWHRNSLGSQGYQLFLDRQYFSLSLLASCSSPRNSTALMIADQVGGGSTVFNHSSNIPMRHFGGLCWCCAAMVFKVAMWRWR